MKINLQEKRKAVILSSGGLDSTTVMYLVKNQGYAIYSLSFNYGQRHKHELNAAKRLANIIGASKHLVLNIELDKIGGSALTDNIDVPKIDKKPGYDNEIPVTYVPARNTIFLSYALAWAEVLGASNIFIGVNALDYSGYPDCRPEYIKAYEKMANLATRTGVEGTTKIKIVTPLINLTKAEIIKKGIALGIDYSLTHSCYDPSIYGKACGLCESCKLRERGFREAGIEDPTIYESCSSSSEALLKAEGRPSSAAPPTRGGEKNVQ
ncbi:7-cyano-7-deazaguanine synthase [Desulfosarcina sp. BuS5]|uniref:7-cyano-7-deazaguanine synthase QueC n=1 Tax=Desulfosarcina sp. BuS5 TaxID=933262 RepID=UPI000B2FA887|nr:7-cyano-7-deazaguanine synthase QueC [Desulfosarcina sp. BuS5]WDN87782.1 7-cyano-7-deazaguanine synthase [Desulfosarcina sp. BuS5]